MSSIIDNQADNTLKGGIERITEGSRQFSVATAFFSLNALVLVARNLQGCDSIRILFGDDSDRTQRARSLAKLRESSDVELEERRAKSWSAAISTKDHCCLPKHNGRNAAHRRIRSW